MLGMYLTPLGIAAVGYAIFVLVRKNKKNDKSSKLTSHYQTLINLLTEGAVSIETKIGTRSVKILFSKNKERHSFHFSEVDNRLIVVWTLDSKQHGKRGKEWSFSMSFDQNLMFNEINEDLGVYNKVLYREK